MATSRTIGSLMVAAIAMGVSADVLAQSPGKPCNNAMLNGAYGVQIQGTRASSPGGPTESVIGVLVRQYDGQGGFSQTGSIKGSISGLVEMGGIGTYQVNADCSVVIESRPSPGVLIQDHGVLVDNSHELRTISALPPTSMVTGRQFSM
jgi:hypothetical protein